MGGTPESCAGGGVGASGLVGSQARMRSSGSGSVGAEPASYELTAMPQTGAAQTGAPQQSVPACASHAVDMPHLAE